MSAKTKAVPDEKVVETATIRLTTDETRAIIRAATCNKPVEDYRCAELASLGIMKEVKLETDEDKKLKRATHWEAAKKAAAREDLSAARKALDELYSLGRDSCERKAYILTDLGKQIARGITVRLNGQYKLPR